MTRQLLTFVLFYDINLASYACCLFTWCEEAGRRATCDWRKKVDISKFRKFAYCGSALTPEIPIVSDVLSVVWQDSSLDHFYSDAISNFTTYADNVVLVAGAVNEDVLRMPRTPDGEAQARKLVAEAIIELCPEEAKCLFNPAYAEALREAGKGVRISGGDAVQLKAFCTCVKCRAETQNASSSVRSFALNPFELA
ncbi:MAG: hypothetical protein NUV81_02715 [bacterium]|nr:hypothetical protein [bacterium]